jgi:hypothetical protein
MGILETEFSRLHWPPLVREVVQTIEYPGYRYEFFRSFRELDAYFTEELGKDWRSEPWALFWINQHKETQNDDRREFSTVKPTKTTGPRRDSKQLYDLCHTYMCTVEKPSSYKFTNYLRAMDIKINQATAWRMMKRWKTKNGKG